MTAEQPSAEINAIKHLASAAVTVRAGDTLLFVLPGTTTASQSSYLHEHLEATLPGVHVLVVSGPSHVIHLPADRTS